MSGASGPRTFPTVKHLATMNNKNLRHWELHIGVIQAVVLAGLVMGAIVCAFFVGYVAGQNRGFEAAMGSNVTSVARLPIAEEPAQASAAQRNESQIYAKLSGQEESTLPAEAGEAAAAGDKAKSLPDLSFARLDDSEKPQPVVDESALETGKKIEAALDSIKSAGKGESTASAGSAGDSVRVLGQSAATSGKAASKDGARTLGSLLPAREDPTREPLAVAPEKAAPVLTAPTAVVDGLKNSQESVAQFKPLTDTGTAATAGVKGAAKSEKENVKTTTASSSVLEPAVKRAEKNSEGPTTKLPHGWFAQVAAPNKKSDSDTLMRKLRSSGFNVVVESAKVRGQDYFRVLVGPEETRSMAEQLVSQLNRESYIEGVPFVRMVK